jgi:transcription-repair coupling factor (superfamily II helicase)
LTFFVCERFGLATLYQLRGRVGRSDRQAYAYFLYHANKLSETSVKRLHTIKVRKSVLYLYCLSLKISTLFLTSQQTITALGSGSRIAEEDRLLRGEGNLFGLEQSGKAFNFGDYGMKMLEDVLLSIREVIFNGVSETFLSINDGIESYSKENRIEIPTPELSPKLNLVSLWENELTERILRENIDSVGVAEGQTNSTGPLVTDKTTTPKKDKSSKKVATNKKNVNKETGSEVQLLKQNQQPRNYSLSENQFIHEFCCTYDLFPLTKILNQFNHTISLVISFRLLLPLKYF